MDLHMTIDELRKELRHMKGRRDFYMGEVGRLKADYRKLQDENLRLHRECSNMQIELKAAQRAARKEEQSDSEVQQVRSHD